MHMPRGPTPSRFILEQETLSSGEGTQHDGNMLCCLRQSEGRVQEQNNATGIQEQP